jgi:FKBP-type peptidyl-prolyl cis-trans isomerase (trigger factor)
MMAVFFMLKATSSHCVISPIIKTYSLTINLSESDIYMLYRYALKMIQKTSIVKGFSQGRVPLQYLERNYKAFLTEHVSQIFFNCYVTDEIIKYAYEKGITPEKNIKQHKLLDTIDNIPQQTPYDLMHISVEPISIW